jgi:CheY-like chemotaxis protein
MATAKTILLVEDDPDDADLTFRALDRNGVANQVVLARDGQVALDWLFCTGAHEGRAPELPAVVLLDLKLPGMSGLDVLEQIRADPRTRFLPVVVLTASKEQEHVVRSYALGANSFVRKPVAFADLAEAVRTLGLYWVLLNEPPT